MNKAELQLNDPVVFRLAVSCGASLCDNLSLSDIASLSSKRLSLCICADVCENLPDSRKNPLGVNGFVGTFVNDSVGAIASLIENGTVGVTVNGFVDVNGAEVGQLGVGRAIVEAGSGVGNGIATSV
jgi:hypothetical protein